MKLDRSAPKNSQILYGIHPVSEALGRGYAFKKLFVRKGTTSPNVENIIRTCKAKKIPFYFADRAECDHLSGNATHQGVVAVLKKGVRFVGDLGRFLDAQANEEHFIVALDRLQDPHNLGAIARTAAFFGARLLVVERSQSAPINATVHKVSSGASLLLNFYQASSLPKTLSLAKGHGYLILAASTNEKAVSLNDFVRRGKRTCLVIGSEGKGLRPSVLGVADEVIRVGFPSSSTNPLNSLNASVAAGILMHNLASAKA